MRFQSLLGLGCFLFAAWRAWRVRRDMEKGETQWERALFGRRRPIYYGETPVKFWCAIAVNTVIVMLMALVGAAVMRAFSGF
ncbi:hypothetical protein [Opitutus sp. ER46]|uniref:hypothetical protein n=1 Tax=Opitutus sp. ER46 TaxID=2161864 RepID=UPI000D31AB6F|nr:hypothetical protein [Opitutus sp. ER46]PTX95575.1 hypothetical protein DB354_09150 [Opitutus sp. ER46]